VKRGRGGGEEEWGGGKEGEIRKREEGESRTCKRKWGDGWK